MCMTVIEGQKVSLREGAKFSLQIPGIEKTVNENSENLCIFVDLGLPEDFDDQEVEAKLKEEHKALFIKSYVQENFFCRNFTTRINIPDNVDNILYNATVNAEIKDGGLMVTIPKLNNTMN